MQEVVIGTLGGTSVVFGDVGMDDEGFGSFTVELHGAGLDVAIGVMTDDRGGRTLDGYFQEVADSWRGWSGVKRWDSVEGDLTIEVDREGGMNRLVFTARVDHPPQWTASLELHVEPGEQATHLANDLRRMFDEARSR